MLNLTGKFHSRLHAIIGGELAFDDIWEDAQHVIATIARQYTDTSHPSLHYDELCSQGAEKLTKMINSDNGNVLQRFNNRKEFFAFFRTAINNHIRGQVQRYRFTLKRTGKKPPPKGERHRAESTKPVEISLDDPDAHLQIDDSTAFDSPHQQMFSDLADILAPVEFLVLQQMHEANNAACLFAEIDSMRGKTKISIDPVIKPCHAAAGIGMSEAEYLSISDRVKQKVLQYMHEDEDKNHNCSVAALEKAFSVQVPRHFDQVVIRRMFTLLARRYIEKLTDDVKTALLNIGAKVPEIKGPTMGCFGVLHDKDNKICQSCTINESCQVEAANFGLDSMTLHPEIIGSRQMRIPTLGVTLRSPSTTVIHDEPESFNERDDEILSYLSENFRGINIRRGGRTETGYKHKDRPLSGVEKIIFCASKRSGSLSLRFCSPGKKLQVKLDSIKNGNYLPAACSASEAIGMIDDHAKVTFTT